MKRIIESEVEKIIRAKNIFQAVKQLDLNLKNAMASISFDLAEMVNNVVRYERNQYKKK